MHICCDLMYQNSTEVDIAPALGKVTEVQNLGQGHRVMLVLGLLE